MIVSEYLAILYCIVDLVATVVKATCSVLVVEMCTCPSHKTEFRIQFGLFSSLSYNVCLATQEVGSS